MIGKRGRPRKNQSSPNKKQKCDAEHEDDSDVDVVDIPEDAVEAPSLRKRRQAQRGKDRKKMDAARRHKEAVRKLTQIFRKPVSERTGAEKKFLTAQTARAINEAKKRNNVKQTIDDRLVILEVQMEFYLKILQLGIRFYLIGLYLTGKKRLKTQKMF